MRKKQKKSEVIFETACILVRYVDYKKAAELAKLIYADVVAPAVDFERRSWEDLNRAKESNSIN